MNKQYETKCEQDNLRSHQRLPNFEQVCSLTEQLEAEHRAIAPRSPQLYSTVALEQSIRCGAQSI